MYKNLPNLIDFTNFNDYLKVQFFYLTVKVKRTKRSKCKTLNSDESKEKLYKNLMSVFIFRVVPEDNIGPHMRWGKTNR